MSIPTYIPPVNNFGLTTVKDSDKEEFVRQQIEHLQTLSSSTEKLGNWESLYNKKWETVQHTGSDNERNYYRCLTQLVISSYLPEVNEYIDYFCDLRKKIKLLSENKYVDKIYAEHIWCYNFSIIDHPDALALVFLFQSKNSILTPDDVSTLQASLSSENEEVIETAKCLLYSRDCQQLIKNIYKKNGIPLHRIGVISKFFEKVVDLDGKIPDFGSPSSIAIINGVSHHFKGFLQRINSKKRDMMETQKYPSNEELHELKHQITLWRAESESRRKIYMESYEALKSCRKTAAFTKKYLIHSLNIEFPSKKLFPTMLEFYNSCHEEKCKEASLSSSSSSSSSSSPSLSSSDLENVPASPLIPKAARGKKKGKKKSKGGSPPLKPISFEKTIASSQLIEAEQEQQAPTKTIKKIAVVPPLVASAPIFLKPAKVILHYHKRVLQWFAPEPTPLMGDSYVNLSPLQKKLQHLFHGFTKTVDTFLKEYSFTVTWFNEKRDHEDTMYCIPGEIHVAGKRMRGLFTYCLGKDSVFYHRYFSLKTKPEFLEYANPAFHRVDFPSLKESLINESLLETYALPIGNEKEKISINPVNHLVTIKDTQHQADLFLYKPPAAHINLNN